MYHVLLLNFFYREKNSFFVYVICRWSGRMHETHNEDDSLERSLAELCAVRVLAPSH